VAGAESWPEPRREAVFSFYYHFILDCQVCQKDAEIWDMSAGGVQRHGYGIWDLKMRKSRVAKQKKRLFNVRFFRFWVINLASHTYIIMISLHKSLYYLIMYTDYCKNTHQIAQKLQKLALANEKTLQPNVSFPKSCKTSQMMIRILCWQIVDIRCRLTVTDR
jgi:hypothetical protein